MEDEKVLAALESFKMDAISNAVNAFNEGFALGEQYAKQVYKLDK